MKKYFPYILLIGICLLFFYKTVLFGKIPFPGDLLLAQYAPWNHQSFGGYVAGAVPSKDQYFDVIREIYPWKSLVNSQLKLGQMPLWNPYNFSGAPLLANYQSQVFYPLTLLYRVLPQMSAWTVMVVLQPMLGSIFMYLFATEIGMSTAAAILAAILFNFSGFANVWIEFTTIWHTILWLPLLLYLVERDVKQKSLTLLQQLLFIFALFSAITGGHPQDFITSFIFLVVYTLFRTWRQKDWSLLYVFIIPFFIAAPQIFPTVELFRHSARVAHDYTGIIENMLVQWWQFPLIAVSDFFGNPATKSNFTGGYVGKTLSVGVVGFVLAAATIWNKETSWHKKFFGWTAFIMLLLTIRTPLSELFYHYPLPILSTGTPTRILFVLMLALSTLAGLGFDAIRKNTNLVSAVLKYCWVFFTILWVYACIHPKLGDLVLTAANISVMKRAMIVATAILAAITGIIVLAKYKKLVFLAIIPLATAELLYGFIKFNPFVAQTFVYPPSKIMDTLKPVTGIDRIWGYGTAGIEANFATQLGLFFPDGTDPLNLEWYNRFIQSSRNGNIAVTFNRTTRSDAQLAPGYGKEDLPANEFRLRIMDSMGVKYVLDRTENPRDEKTFAPPRFKEIQRVDDWVIYENLMAAPRFFATYDVRPYTDTKDFETQFFDPLFNPAKTVLVEAKDMSKLPKFPILERPITVRLTSYTPNTVTLSVDADAPVFLFFSDTFDYGWAATVNGKPTTVYKADFAFRGVVLPKGESTVVFTYAPKSFQTGVVLSLFALLITILYVAYYHKTQSSE